MIQERYTIQEKTVVDVFNRHFAAFNEGDLEGVLEDFSEDSVIITQDGVFTGLSGVRRVFGALIDEFGDVSRGDSPGFTLDLLRVHADTLFITWHAESKSRVFSFGTDTFLIDGQKILRQTISFARTGPSKP